MGGVTDWNVEYQTVGCLFCRAEVGRPCVKIYGKNAGDPTDWPHQRRAYRYWYQKRTQQKTS